MGHTGLGGSCRGVVGHTGVGWVMKGWGGPCRGGVGHASVGWCGSCSSCRGGVGWVNNSYSIKNSQMDMRGCV